MNKFINIYHFENDISEMFLILNNLFEFIFALKQLESLVLKKYFFYFITTGIKSFKK